MTAKWFSFSILLVLVSGCALFKQPEYPTESYGPKESVFYAEYDQVWRATLLALQRYPITVNNMDIGVIETDAVRGENIWSPPHKPITRRGGLAYVLSLRVIKGKVQGKSAIKVAVSKNIEIQRDFFADKEKQASDGLEEKTILYRIGRELQIDRALNRFQNQQNTQAPSP